MVRTQQLLLTKFPGIVLLIDAQSEVFCKNFRKQHRSEDALVRHRLQKQQLTLILWYSVLKIHQKSQLDINHSK